MVYGAGLENQSLRKGTGGSNPSPSAIYISRYPTFLGCLGPYVHRTRGTQDHSVSVLSELFHSG